LKIKQKIFGFTKEDNHVIIGQMVKGKKDPIGSMGSDTPLAILSKHSQHLANYFKQLFAQVTNPPIDPIREKAVMSLSTQLGRAYNIMKPGPHLAKFIHLDNPILKDADLARIKALDHPDFNSEVIDITFPAKDQKGLLRGAISNICARAEDITRRGINVIILSDRGIDSDRAPIPSLLATGAIHHHLIQSGLRNLTSIVVEAGDIRETHHLATLVGYGANAVNPYLSFATIRELAKDRYFEEDRSIEEYIDAYIYAMGSGLLKIMSKIGISMLRSYHGAQIFEAIGLDKEVINAAFNGTVSRIKGISFNGIAKEAMTRFKSAYTDEASSKIKLDTGGVYQWKRRGEYHLFNPQTIHLLQYSSRTNDYDMYKKFAQLIDDQSEQACTLRGLMTFRKSTPIDIEDVEPVESIMKRFVTGAMSFGSISHEAHSTLAIAMNRIGGKSNSGEGGEDEIRFEKKANGDWERSATKQVASGRFGVTSYYLTNADELQIKMAQGAKPGEGGQLPGHKVDEWIGRVRHSTPGVGLISPPPHHDIYSIEDLAQLIFDLKNANRHSRINVKLVSKAGVGIIASGVAKAHADAILISGHDGGTGASPLSSIRHAGLPWELGLAESHQTLVQNQLRDRVTLQTDGQIRTGRDIAIATLLGAEEWGVATAALVVEGCILMRKCHLNTCPVGIATQDPDLRKRYNGSVEAVINYFRFLATDMRERMASLGFRSINEMVGKVELLKFKQKLNYWKYQNLDLSPILYKVPSKENVGQYKRIPQNHGLEDVLDKKLIKYAEPALEGGHNVQTVFPIYNTDRTTGAMLSHEISKRYKADGLPDGTIDYRFRGSAGQSFGAFGARGIQFTLEGEANDYFGKGLSGGRLIVVPDRDAQFNPSENIIIGNVAFYGATSGEAYIKGMAGERFAVRNSGVHAVVEGTGDH
ncbi:MAG: glutamate synthase large subunit, partial [Bacteroidia bacterium]|nr:glutamate synthase large subunit [Bacteroidia bacterium]